jgi:carbon monoxide dehydrogenase subunit G
MSTIFRSLPFSLALLLLVSASNGAPRTPDDIEVEVHKDGHLVRVQIDLVVDATRDETWDVLTDYDGMAAFVPTVESSVIVSRDGNNLEVAQKGKAARGPFSMRFANVRRVELTPKREIHSRIVSGDLAPGEVTTRIDSSGPLTRVTVTGVYSPHIWVPPVIGPALIASETKEQWQVLRKEIMHRRGTGG